MLIALWITFIMTALPCGGVARVVAAALIETDAPVVAPQYVEVSIGLRWRNCLELEQLLRDLINPSSPRFERYLSPAEFLAQFAPTPDTIDAARAILAEQGLEVTSVSSSRLFLRAAGRVSDIAVARAEALRQLRALVAEERLYFQLLSSEGSGAGAGVTDMSVDLHPFTEAGALSPQLGNALWPADLAATYGFDRLYARGVRGESARHATIAIATAFGFERADLGDFWAAAGIARDDQQVELIWPAGPSSTTHVETAADTQWASALAPASPIIVYAGVDASAHNFLQVYDRIVDDNRAAVVSTSWGACERQLSPTYLEQAHVIFQRAAAQGITVVAASGDNGADGCRDGHPGVSFPASDPYVLAVGGTSLTEVGGAPVETVWPNSGGGISDKWPAPPWQMQPEPYRALADVALHADPARGFATRVEGRARLFGGTSLAAPSWAALVALSNQLRAQMQRAPLGIAAAALCEVAQAEASPGAFRDVLSGDNGGYEARPGWDFPTGWGSPVADVLAERLASWLPPLLNIDDLKRSFVLTPTRADGGSVRLQLFHRCSGLKLRLAARHLEEGTYDIVVDDQTVASFSVGSGGGAALQLSGVDPRGRQVSILRNGGAVVATAWCPHEPTPPLQAVLEFNNEGLWPAATARALYRRSATRARLVVHARGLPPGYYGVRFGTNTLAWLTVPPGRTGGHLRLDSAGLGGDPLPFNPLCDSISITYKGTPILHAPRTARDPTCV